MTVPETFKIVVALDKSLEAGIAMNAAAHLMLGLKQAIELKHEQLHEMLQFITYRSADGVDLPFISARSLIMLRARQADLRRLLGEFGRIQVPTTCFTDTMTGGDYRDQLARSAATAFLDMTIYGVAALGPRADIDPLTRKLSLWR